MHKSRRAFPLLLRVLFAVLLLVAAFFLTLRLLPSRTGRKYWITDAATDGLVLSRQRAAARM